jgi:hypothetical protein
MLYLLAGCAETEWLARLDDDDLFLPRHLEVLASGTADADVIYTWCEVRSRPTNGTAPPVPTVLGPRGWIPNQEFDSELLKARNYIPATTLIRRSLWHELGGWRLPGWGLAETPSEPEYAEDWEFWLRALDVGARFLCIPEVTWVYRYHGKNVWFR